MDSVWVEFLCCFLFVIDCVLIYLYGVGVWVVGGVGFYFRIYCYQGVVFVVYIEVEVEVIDVLVSGVDNIMVD